MCRGRGLCAQRNPDLVEKPFPLGQIGADNRGPARWRGGRAEHPGPGLARGTAGLPGILVERYRFPLGGDDDCRAQAIATGLHRGCQILDLGIRQRCQHDQLIAAGVFRYAVETDLVPICGQQCCQRGIACNALALAVGATVVGRRLARADPEQQGQKRHKADRDNRQGAARAERGGVVSARHASPLPGTAKSA